MNYPPFYVSQKVMYITGKNLTKDSVWEVLAMAQMACGCWLIDIGIGKTDKISPSKYEKCTVCNSEKHLMDNPERINWFYAISFSPILPKYESITFEKILEKELVSNN